MGLETLLSRLDKVRAGNAVGRWNACCPAHQDRSPSLTIRLEDDGRILLHCFAGCEPDAVLSAIGLQFSDLFPEPLTREFLPRIPAPFSPLDALKCLTAESSIVAIAASDIVNGKPLDAQDLDRVATAAGRIATALEVIHG
jgi:hypothetical protein